MAGRRRGERQRQLAQRPPGACRHPLLPGSSIVGPRAPQGSRAPPCAPPLTPALLVEVGELQQLLQQRPQLRQVIDGRQPGKEGRAAPLEHLAPRHEPHGSVDMYTRRRHRGEARLRLATRVCMRWRGPHAQQQGNVSIESPARLQGDRCVVCRAQGLPRNRALLPPTARLPAPSQLHPSPAERIRRSRGITKGWAIACGHWMRLAAATPRPRAFPLLRSCMRSPAARARPPHSCWRTCRRCPIPRRS